MSHYVETLSYRPSNIPNWEQLSNAESIRETDDTAVVTNMSVRGESSEVGNKYGQQGHKSFMTTRETDVVCPIQQGRIMPAEDDSEPPPLEHVEHYYPLQTISAWSSSREVATSDPESNHIVRRLILRGSSNIDRNLYHAEPIGRGRTAVGDQISFMDILTKQAASLSLSEAKVSVKDWFTEQILPPQNHGNGVKRELKKARESREMKKSRKEKNEVQIATL